MAKIPCRNVRPGLEMHDQPELSSNSVFRGHGPDAFLRRKQVPTSLSHEERDGHPE